MLDLIEACFTNVLLPIFAAIANTIYRTFFMPEWRRKAERIVAGKARAARLEEEAKAAATKVAYVDTEKANWDTLHSILCHVCGKRAEKPHLREWTTSYGGDDNYHEELQWHVPDDMIKCSLGDHWVHPWCTHLGMCKICIDALPE